MDDPSRWLEDNRSVIFRDPDDQAVWKGDATANDEVAELVSRRRPGHWAAAAEA
jgi:hypothetical protein